MTAVSSIIFPARQINRQAEIDSLLIHAKKITKMVSAQKHSALILSKTIHEVLTNLKCALSMSKMHINH